MSVELRPSLGRFERAGVEFLVKIGKSFVSDGVERWSDLLQQPSFCQSRTPTACMVCTRDAELLDCGRVEVSPFPKQFEDSVVNWHHPVGVLPWHIISVLSRRFSFICLRFTHELCLSKHLPCALTQDAMRFHSLFVSNN